MALPLSDEVTARLDVLNEHAKQLTVKFKRPPNAAAIQKVFPTLNIDAVIFAYGDTIFAPSGIEVPKRLLVHEAEHSKRQLDLFGVDLWWQRYLADKQFRFDEELFAHRVEFFFVAQSVNRTERKQYLRNVVAERLSGPLYGNLVKRKIAQDLIAGTTRWSGHDAAARQKRAKDISDHSRAA